jgi:hypothetical protein
MKLIINFLKRVPFTLIMLAGLILASLVTNTTFQSITHHWLNRIGFAPRDLWYWRLERIFTSALVTSGGKVFWEALFYIAFAVGLTEWMMGWKRTAVTFWGIHILVLVLFSVIVSLTMHQLRDFGLEASEAARDVGPSVGYFACLGVVSANLKRPWNWVSGAAIFSIFVVAIFLPVAPGESAQLKFSADLAHMLAFPFGWLSAGIGRNRSWSENRYVQS